MNWEVLDLLERQQIDSFVNARRLPEAASDERFDLIVDKGTIDSTASRESLPLRFATFDELAAPERPHSSRLLNDTLSDDHHVVSFVEPPCLMALHLALLTKPGATWICVSYSAERFSFLEEDLALPRSEVGPSGSVLPNDFWRVEKKQAIETSENFEAITESTVHKPKVYYWLYILKRN